MLGLSYFIDGTNFFSYNDINELLNCMFSLSSVSEGCERIVNTAVSANIIIYMTKEYHMGAAPSTVIVFAYQAATNFLPIFGAILSDALWGRFLTISLTLFACTIVRSSYLPMYKPFLILRFVSGANMQYILFDSVLVFNLGCCSDVVDNNGTNISCRRLWK
jgi:hypothetical protein